MLPKFDPASRCAAFVWRTPMTAKSRKLTIALSPAQAAAIKLIADERRLTPEETFKILAFMLLDTCHTEPEAFWAHYEDVRDALLEGDVPFPENDGLCGFIGFEDYTSAAQAAKFRDLAERLGCKLENVLVASGLTPEDLDTTARRMGLNMPAATS